MKKTRILESLGLPNSDRNADMKKLCLNIGFPHYVLKNYNNIDINDLQIIDIHQKLLLDNKDYDNSIKLLIKISKEKYTSELSATLKKFFFL